LKGAPSLPGWRGRGKKNREVSIPIAEKERALGKEKGEGVNKNLSQKKGDHLRNVRGGRSKKKKTRRGGLGKGRSFEKGGGIEPM